MNEVADHPRRPFSHASPTLGLSSRVHAACALQLSKTASLVVLRLLNAADHRGRPRTAAGGSEGSQDKSREPRSPTSRCTARLRLLQMAVVGRFKQELAAIPHNQLLVLGGPSASAAGRAVGDTGRERRGRFTCDFAKVTTCGPPQRGPRPDLSFGDGGVLTTHTRISRYIETRWWWWQRSAE